MALKESQASLGAQLRAVQQARWRMMIHSLRSVRGKLELGSKILVTFLFVVGGCGLGMVPASFPGLWSPKKTMRGWPPSSGRFSCCGRQFPCC